MNEDVAFAGVWVDVDERLPEKDGIYGVRTARGTVTKARFYAEREFSGTCYREPYTRPASWQSNRAVTHWLETEDQKEAGR